MLKRMFNRLVAKTSIYKGLFALYTGEMKRSNYYKAHFLEASDEYDNLYRKVSKLEKTARKRSGYADLLEETLDMAISDKERAIGASVALSAEVAHLRKCIDSTEYLQKYIAEHADKLDSVAGSPGWAVKMLAKSFAETMGNAPNFVSTVVSHPDYGDFEYMVRRRDSKTIGEWAHEVMGHLKAMVTLAGKQTWGQGDAELYVDAEDFVRGTEKLTHDFVTRENEVKTEFKAD